MAPFVNKLVAVMNKNIEGGIAMNALAHMCVGLGAKAGAAALELMTYRDAAGGEYADISKMPFMVLRGTEGKLRLLQMEAKQLGILCSVFTDTMTVGTWQDQEARTLQTAPENLVFYGVVLFGHWEQVSELTKKFSLWR